MVKKRKAVGPPDWAAIEDGLRDQCAVYSVEYRKPSPNEKSTARENRHRKLKDLISLARRGRAAAEAIAEAAAAEAGIDRPVYYNPKRVGEVNLRMARKRAVEDGMEDGEEVGEEGDVDGVEDCEAMAVEEAPSPPTQSWPPSGWWFNYSHTSGGTATRTPGRGPNGGETPDWLRHAWGQRWPHIDSPDSRGAGDAFAYAGSRGALDVNGALHPSECACGRPECPWPDARRVPSRPRALVL